MPVDQGIIEALLQVPISAQRPVLDEHGPYAAGDYTITDFLTTTAHGLLPAGTWPIGGTYGVLVQPTTFPAPWGVEIGYDSHGAIGFEGYIWDERFAQVVVMHQALGGLFVTVGAYDCRTVLTYVPMPLVLLGGDRIGLHVTPGVSVDLYFMCVLA